MAGEIIKCIADSGCSKTVISPTFAGKFGLKVEKKDNCVEMLNGTKVDVRGTCSFKCVAAGKERKIDALVIPGLLSGCCDIVVGYNMIRDCGGLIIYGNGSATWLDDAKLEAHEAGFAGANVMRRSIEARSKEMPKAANEKGIVIADKDFKAWFNGKHWTMEWVWKSGPKMVHNRKPNYGFHDINIEKLNAELDSWVEKGWLVECEDGQIDNVIPIMGKAEPAKDRVRPVLDFREFNSLILNYPGADSAVCSEKLREWRQMGTQVSILDLTKAYLQVHVPAELWKYQAVRFKGKTYMMTRMAFGLAIAPKVMGRIVKYVLSLVPEIECVTDSYIDDIFCVSPRVDVQRVKQHLAAFGLESKDPVQLEGARVLGLRVSQDHNGQFHWRRDNAISAPESELTREQLYSFCGKLVGHYPVAGWLRVCCSYVKRITSEIAWDQPVGQRAQGIAEAIWKKVSSGEDPVKGVWSVQNTDEGSVWCDASSLAMGCILIMDNVVLEDGCWLRAKDDAAHINVAELEAAVRGINMALKWNIHKLKLFTDSATVAKWLESVISGDKRVKTSGLSEMITKRRLGIVKELIDLYALEIKVIQVKSAENLADGLTRVPKDWMVDHKDVGCFGHMEPTTGSAETLAEIQRIHCGNHFGIRRTLYLARKQLGSQVRKKQVQQVCHSCQRCKSVDPAPVKFPEGSLKVTGVWERWAIDVTHYESKAYLTVIDTRSRYCMWRYLSAETAEKIVQVIRGWFLIFGPPKEILSDNATVFHSQCFESLLAEFSVKQLFACAYRPQGNGVIERNHRTIKRMAARSNKPVEEMVYFYNITPGDDGEIPASMAFSFQPRVPGEKNGGSPQRRSVEPR